MVDKKMQLICRILHYEWPGYEIVVMLPMNMVYSSILILYGRFRLRHIFFIFMDSGIFKSFYLKLEIYYTKMYDECEENLKLYKN